MANLDKNLLPAGSAQVGPYGPHCNITRDPQGTSLVNGDGKVLAHLPHLQGALSVDLTALDPTTVPYVNAFVREHGVVDKYWRTKAYRFRPIAGAAPAAPARLPQPVRIGADPFASPGGGADPFAAPAPVAPAPVVPAPLPGTSAPVAPPPSVLTRKRPRNGVKAPEGFVVIEGRSGESLVIPKRTVDTFNAAVKARFDDGLPAHPLAIGPTGTGKTETIIALALAAGMEIAGVVQMGGIEGPADLYGQTVPDETAPHGWRRRPSALWAALDIARCNPDRRYAVVLDEVNRIGTLAAQNSLLGMLDGTEALQNPATGETIPLPANLFVIATANIGIAYSGTVRMDAALMSRWWTNLSFGYLPEKVEVAIVKAIIGADDQARYLARAARELRNAHAQDEFRSALIPGTREIVAVAHQAKHDPEGVAGAWHDKVTSSFSNEGRDPSRTEYARVRVLSEGIFKAAAPTEEREAAEAPPAQ